MKLALGTVQLGLDYGINNKRGKIPEAEIFDLFKFTSAYGINFIDTARSYGKSEEIIGRCLGEAVGQFNIISKISVKDEDDVKKQFVVSLKNLRCNRLYGYLLHSFSNYLDNRKVWDGFIGLQKSGLVKKIGFSLYYPSELERLFKDKVKFDLVQVPYNIFDQRFDSYLPELKKEGVEVHARSIFLQGLFFRNAAELPDNLRRIGKKLKALRVLSERSRIPLEALCLVFAALNKNIDKLVIGVDSLEHIRLNVGAFDYEDKTRRIYDDLLSFKEDDEDVLIPTKWGLHNG